jgi:uncharacterized membrane-anchored protein
MNLDIPAFSAKLQNLLGIPADKADQYANTIGDTPEVDANGLVVIRDEKNEIIDRISIPLF